jgi:hypothetical protein
LDSDSAADCVGGRCKRGKQAITQPLQLFTAGCGDRVAQLLVVSLKDLCSGLITDSLQMRSRIDEIRIEKRDDLRLRHC